MALEPKDEIRALLARINDAWLKGRPEDLSSLMDGCFSENMVIVGPAFQVMGRGREACIAGYADFIRAAKSGHDVFVFTRAGGNWRAVWRALLTS